MNWKPQQTLSEKDIKKGLSFSIGDGLATEVMTTLTGTTFLIAIALLLGATNFEIGLLAAFPVFTNVFQLISIWLVRRLNNRRIISFVCSILARIPLVMLGLFILSFRQLTMQPLLVFLFIYYFFGSLAGPSWNAWMKDLVPENLLGAYFSKRSSYMQMLNIIVSLLLALILEFIRKNYPQYELNAYAIMFIMAGSVGIAGAFILAKVPEPQGTTINENIFRLLKKPLKDGNFRRLLIFNSVWVFALNIASPFFVVFMMKSMGLSLIYIIGLTIASQLSSILTIRTWGRYADQYSNKTIIAIGAPLYILCLAAWCFVGIYSHPLMNLTLLILIHIAMGVSTAGINLSLTNIGLKLAPKNESIIYLATKNIGTAIFSSLGPLLGGYLADYFTKRSLIVNAEWVGPRFKKTLHLVSLHEWNFLFLIGAFLAIIALQFLFTVKETGEVEKDEVRRIMRSSLRNNLKDYFVIGQLISLQEQLWRFVHKKTLSNPGTK